MAIRNQIEQLFKGKAFKRPLFYSYEGGLRFQLSVDGSYVHKFITANKKAAEICQMIFSEKNEIHVCLKLYGEKHLFSSLSIFRELRELGINIPKKTEHWSEPDKDDDQCYWHYLVFRTPNENLSTLLWCACASDFGSIRPNPGVIVYLFNLDQELIAHPYDDRGMDVVGNNHGFLKALYTKFNSYLLEYDREVMEATFR